MINYIEIKGAREHNLKDISLKIPKNKLVVITGPSGSGKSTLALDTLQRECQRQYMESMGMTADAVSKPKVESIIGLSPSISIGQHLTNRNPRSTVGTTTDMYTYLRVIYEKLGERPCPNCHETILPHFDKEEYDEEAGFKQWIHCPHCNHRFEKLTRSHFSFNKPEGACSTCDGLGNVVELDYESVFQEELSLNEGCVTIWKGQFQEYQLNILETAAKYYGLSLDFNRPLKDFDDVQKYLLYYGAESDPFISHFPDKKVPKTVSQGKFEGVVTGIWRRYREKSGQSGEAKLFFSKVCPDCSGQRLNESSRLVSVAGTSITTLTMWSLDDILTWIEKLQSNLPLESMHVVEALLHDLKSKVTRIVDVGLGYLSLDRQTITLSGGEAQRLRLATILGSGLTGVLYILDEPTAGLHPKDTHGLMKVMKELRDLGNTVLVIEHDEDMMSGADHIIDFGPGAGKYGGTIVGEGTIQQIKEDDKSVTGAFLRKVPSLPHERRKGNGKFLTVHNASKHNLKNITVSFPLGSFISVTGVSGSGKSTLVFDALSDGIDIRSDKITGHQEIKNMITVNQSPLTRMQRSNIATYTDAFTLIRNLFASLPEAKEKSLKPKDFSFNTQGGRCEHCQGLGVVLTNMHFLPDLEVTCPVCKGNRFKDFILDITYKGETISSILDLTIEESRPLFEDVKKIRPIIELLCDVGLGYLSWGQSVTTLSGGEGQRLKLAKELYKQKSDHTLYLLDEPTRGLHSTDVNKLLLLLNRLVDAGNTVIVVEHTLEVIRASDWVIDIGPEGGEAGGQVVAEGTPEQIARTEASYTGKFLNFS
ncbi:excinuclease ABC subunit UvrA [Pseudalkalibacillus salsuginis]|uniref:excinuclease ABC subunit UvrA n=1 Tax=Pseudalkalibacillus salsuginis TaxID=2910972 RepID=UPI001F1E427B|nr:excinuclease ABC subunit UvrA [Pseudalkalibacillus salsuginis]MCF6411411.1 excinuclease ABC subunit UvrA [Pseudalkalibacillus salsuginis]